MNQSQLWKHVAALIYDIFPIIALFFTTSLILIILRQGVEVQPRTFWFQFLLYAQAYLYFTYSWKKGGQTLGMRAWKISIVNHQQLSWSDVSKRFVIGLLSTLLLGLGLWTRRFSEHNNTWMDWACGEKVFDIANKSKKTE